MQTEEKNTINNGFAPDTGDMRKEDFRRFGYEMIDWIADYFENMEDFPVLSQIEPNWLKNNLPKSRAGKGRRFRGSFGRCRKIDFARRNTLESSEFSRTFFDFDKFGRRFRRNAFRRFRYESDALAHVARFDRTRTRRSRLASQNDESARRFSTA